MVYPFPGNQRSNPWSHNLHVMLEYMTLAKATQEGLYLIQLLNKMDPLREYVPVKIFKDNQGAIALPGTLYTKKYVNT